MRIGTTIKNRQNSITGKFFLFSKIAATADPFIMSVPKVSNANCQENSSRFVAALIKLKTPRDIIDKIVA